MGVVYWGLCGVPSFTKELCHLLVAVSVLDTTYPTTRNIICWMHEAWIGPFKTPLLKLNAWDPILGFLMHLAVPHPLCFQLIFLKAQLIVVLLSVPTAYSPASCLCGRFPTSVLVTVACTTLAFPAFSHTSPSSWNVLPDSARQKISSWCNSYSMASVEEA